jgi:predicted aldo/keto reductase-like oxidoreductase
MNFFDVILAPLNFKMRHRVEMKQVLKQAHDNGLGVVAMKTQAIYDNNMDTNHTAALKYALQNEYVTTAIPGFQTFDQLDEDFSVVRNLEYTDQEKDYLEKFGVEDQKNDSALNRPCQQCEMCIQSCVKGLDIPDLMRTYMYATGYKNFEHARVTYESIPQNRNLSLCKDCKSCTARCVNGLDIAANMNQLQSIFC